MNEPIEIVDVDFTAKIVNIDRAALIGLIETSVSELEFRGCHFTAEARINILAPAN